MRYLLFAGEGYYPNGGVEDYRGSCDSIDEVKELLIQLEITDKRKKYGEYADGVARGVNDWAHIAIFDGTDLRIICRWGSELGWEVVQ